MTPPDKSPAVDRERWPYRMKDLCERTGLPRQAIHFYIQQRLLPEPHKAGRNMAYYGEEHVERVQLIRRLQQERFLPLKAIRALLEGREDSFTAEQRRLFGGLRAALGSALGARATEPVLVKDALQRLALEPEEVKELVEAGLVATATTPGGHEVIARDDLWLLELRAAMRDAGFTREFGFTSRDLALYDEAIAALLQREAQLLAPRLAPLPPERITAMLERGLPLINELITRLHLARVRNFIDTL